MNVRELIEALTTLDPDQDVKAEGCSQCVNLVTSVTFDPKYGVTLDVKL